MSVPTGTDDTGVAEFNDFYSSVHVPRSWSGEAFVEGAGSSSSATSFTLHPVHLGTVPCTKTTIPMTGSDSCRPTSDSRPVRLRGSSATRVGDCGIGASGPDV